MESTSYEIDSHIQLTHSDEQFPEPEPGELERLKAEAARLGYSLKRSHSREKLYHYILPVLAEFPKLARVLTVNTDGRSYRDFENLYFIPYEASRETIATVEEELPKFLQRLWNLESISANVSMSFEDSDRKVPTIKLEWRNEELLRSEIPAKKPITEAELHAHYRRLAED